MARSKKEPLYAVAVCEGGVVEDVALVRGRKSAIKAGKVIEQLSGGEVSVVRVVGARQLASEYEEAK